MKINVIFNIASEIPPYGEGLSERIARIGRYPGPSPPFDSVSPWGERSEPFIDSEPFIEEGITPGLLESVPEVGRAIPADIQA